MCDPRDLGVALTEDISGGIAQWEPNLYLYDAYSGGVGLSAPLYRLSDPLIAQTAELLHGCGCEAGCPACVGPVGEIGDRGKEVAAAILQRLAYSDASVTPS
jgi:DEAD/DEAH box helicase domain-containing protein